MPRKPFDISDVSPPEPVTIAGSNSPHIAWRLIRDMAHSLAIFGEDSDLVRTQKIEVAVEMAKDLAPKDALEAQLIAQLISSHNIAAEAMQRANQLGQTPQIQMTNLKLAAQFMGLFRDQVKALTGYRGTPREMRRDAEEQAKKDELPRNITVRFIDPKDVKDGKWFGTDINKIPDYENHLYQSDE